MDPRSLAVLEWPRVVALLAAESAHALGRDRCQALEPGTRLDEVSLALRLTGECRKLMDTGLDVPQGGITDIRQALGRASRGIVLVGEELIAIANTLKGGKRVKEFLTEHAEDAPALAELGEPIAALGDLASTILATFDNSGEVADSASPELGKLRHKVRETQARIRSTLQRIIAGQSASLQEAIVTLRGDRYVLPVRADAHGSIPGIVHDQSSTGATLFVEPSAVVEANNQLRQAQLAERAEIQRILGVLTDRVRAVEEPIHWNCEALADIDFTVAKARLAGRLGGHAPRLNREGRMRLFRARHPLLVDKLGHATVPVDVTLGNPDPILLITGPNTGGKTVTLKTVGLCVLMAQAGLFPPIADGSEISVVHAVFADIGDEQSLSQNLSTFSGHMTNIIRILAAADARTLVLLDELGAGTDPTEGAALGRAVIETLLARDARLLATTHYGELKMLAYELPGVRNAAVEFDLETLSPTYRLLLGVSGQSNAVAIAERLGLSPDLIARARQLLAARATDAAVTMQAIERDRHAAAEILQQAQWARDEAEALRSQYRDKVSGWQAERKDLEAKSKEKIEQQVRSAKGEIAAIIRNLQAVNTAQAAQHAGERLEKYNKVKTKLPPAPPGPKAEEIAIGKTVFVPKLGQNGRITSLPDKDGQMSVQVGILTVSVHMSALATRTGAPLVQPAAVRKMATSDPAWDDELRMTMDLRGRLVHEAVPDADVYLDKAFRARMDTVALIHGSGSGALRNAIREWLKGHPHVVTFRPGGAGEGGDGVTMVTLK